MKQAHDNENVGLWVFWESNGADQWLMTGQPDMLSFSDWQTEAVGSLSNSRIGSEPELDTAKRWECP